VTFDFIIFLQFIYSKSTLLDDVLLLKGIYEGPADH